MFKKIAPRALILVLALTGTSLRSSAQKAPRGPSGYDLSISLEADPDPVATGAEVTVVLTAFNAGPADASSAVIEIATPEGTTFGSASGGTVDAPAPGGTGTVRFTFDSGIQAEQGVEANATFTVTAEPGEVLIFDASVAGPNDSEQEASPDDNATTLPVNVSSNAEADVAVEVFPLADEAGSGTLFSYEVDVTNVSEGEDSAQGVTVSIDVPHGTTFSSVETFSDDCSAPPVGSAGGTVVCVFGELAPGDGGSILVTVRVAAAPGAEIELTASAETSSTDADEGNNFASEFVDVVEGPPTALDWDEPDDDAPTAFPPPRNLEVEDSPEGRAPKAFRPAATRDVVKSYNIYGSTTPGVMPMPGNLITTVPATTTSATVPAAPAGTFFIVTAVYDAGESGPSNETSAQVPAATIAQLKIKGSKIQMSGTNFSDNAAVFVDGIPFGSPAKIKKNHTKLIQKGALLTGQTIGTYLATHPTVFITVRNDNGGVASYTYPR